MASFNKSIAAILFCACLGSSLNPISKADLAKAMVAPALKALGGGLVVRYLLTDAREALNRYNQYRKETSLPVSLKDKDVRRSNSVFQGKIFATVLYLALIGNEVSRKIFPKMNDGLELIRLSAFCSATIIAAFQASTLADQEEYKYTLVRVYNNGFLLDEYIREYNIVYSAFFNMLLTSTVAAIASFLSIPGLRSIFKKYEQCPICLEPLKRDVVSPCSNSEQHKFHKACIGKTNMTVTMRVIRAFQILPGLSMQQVQREGKFLCPLCRAPLDPKKRESESYVLPSDYLWPILAVVAWYKYPQAKRAFMRIAQKYTPQPFISHFFGLLDSGRQTTI